MVMMLTITIVPEVEEIMLSWTTSKKFTLEQIEEAMENYIGFCISCGAERELCEPDARNYQCFVCEADEVFGAEELVVMGLVI